MTKQRPASLNSSLLVKKGQAKPSVTSPEPVEKKEPRFPDPDAVSALPLTSTPPISELYGKDSSADLKAETATAPPLQALAREEAATPKREPVAPLTANAPGPDAPREEHGTANSEPDTAPEPRLVVLLPRPSLRFVFAAILMAVMGVSAWYLFTGSENGTQQLTSVSPTAQDVTTRGNIPEASAISPPPSGISSPSAKPGNSKSGQAAKSETITPANSAAAPIPSSKPTSPTAPAAVAAAGPRYAIQLLATKSEAAGEAAWTQIVSKHGTQLDGLSLDLQTVTLQGRGTFVRVRAGPIAERNVAAERCSQLSAAGQDCLVVRF